MTKVSDTVEAEELRRAERNRWKALAVGLVAGFMTLLDVSIVNVALPSIRTGLHADESALQWIVSGYALAFGLVLVPAGRLGDARSRRGVFMFGLTLFTLASAAAGLARVVGWLVAARLVQGAAGGVINPQISGLIQQLFRGHERGRAFGMLGATIGIATAVGPLTGGLLIGAAGLADGWRWVFYVNIPVGMIALVLAWRFLPAGSAAPSGRRESLDPVGVLLLGVGVILLLLPFVEQPWRGAGKWLLIPTALIVLAVFVVWERWYARRREPVVDLSLFGRRSYALGATLILLYFAGFSAIFFIYTLYVQAGIGYTPLQAGLAMTPFALGSGIASMVGGRAVSKVGRPLVAGGLLLVIVGFVAVDVVVHMVPGPRVGLATALPLLVAGIGSGLVIAPNQTITLSEVPPNRGGAAGGLGVLLRRRGHQGRLGGRLRARPAGAAGLRGRGVRRRAVGSDRRPLSGRGAVRPGGRRRPPGRGHARPPWPRSPRSRRGGPVTPARSAGCGSCRAVNAGRRPRGCPSDSAPASPPCRPPARARGGSAG
jgi:EmrB/QacA subfamily drug resistance transporter